MKPSLVAPAKAWASIAVLLPWISPFAPGPSPGVVQWLVTLGGVVVLLLLWALRTLSRVQFAQACAQGWLLAALISSLLAIVQYLGFSGALSPWADGTAVGDAFANLRQRNQFATLVNIGLGTLLLWESYPGPRGAGAVQQNASLSDFSMALMAALLAIGNAASSSRTGLIQLLLLGGLLTVWRVCTPDDEAAKVSRYPMRLWALACLVYLVALLLLPRLAGLDPMQHGLLARLSAGDQLCASRLTLWGNVLHLIALKPWFGWGWGELDFAHFDTLYNGVRFCDILDNAHNLPLHLAVELGVPFALVTCGGAVLLTLHARPWLEVDRAKRMAWAVLAVILLHSMLEYPLWYGPFFVAAALSVLLLVGRDSITAPSGTGRNGDAYEVPARARASFILGTFLAVGLIGFTTYTAWDYHRISQIFLPPTLRDEAYRADTLSKLQGSWLFADHVRYAELTTTQVTIENAAWVYPMGQQLLHFSPEPRVIKKLLEAAVLLNKNEEALYYLQRFKAAFPQEAARWVRRDSLDAEED